MAALIASELQNKYSADNIFVACIFADEVLVDWGETHLEAVLLSILSQLSPHHRQEAWSYGELDAQAHHHDAENTSESSNGRIHELCGALSSRLLQLELAFLILDGVDQCGWFTQFCLEDVILDLHKQHPHFRVLLTSRTIPIRRDEYGRCGNTRHQHGPKVRCSSNSNVQKWPHMVYPARWSTADTCGLWLVTPASHF
jgi:hypothetical protein